MNHIYILEDDENINEIECFALKSAGYEVTQFHQAKELYHGLHKRIPALLVLDVMLPDANGIHIVEKLRHSKETAKMPILLVSGNTKELDIVRGLDAGADDYLTKPFGVMELVSRVKALLRRKLEDCQPTVEHEHIVVDSEKRRVYVNGDKCDVTYKEFELLYLLVKNKGKVLKRDFLMEEIWGIDFEGESRTLDMHIRTIRKKLGDEGAKIKTIRNVGYRYDS